MIAAELSIYDEAAQVRRHTLGFTLQSLAHTLKSSTFIYGPSYTDHYQTGRKMLVCVLAVTHQDGAAKANLTLSLKDTIKKQKKTKLALLLFKKQSAALMFAHPQKPVQASTPSFIRIWRPCRYMVGKKALDLMSQSHDLSRLSNIV